MGRNLICASFVCNFSPSYMAVLNLYEETASSLPSDNIPPLLHDLRKMKLMILFGFKWIVNQDITLWIYNMII